MPWSDRLQPAPSCSPESKASRSERVQIWSNVDQPDPPSDVTLAFEKKRSPHPDGYNLYQECLSKNSYRFFTSILRASVNRARGQLSPIAFERRNEFALRALGQGERSYLNETLDQPLEIIAA